MKERLIYNKVYCYTRARARNNITPDKYIGEMEDHIPLMKYDKVITDDIHSQNTMSCRAEDIGDIKMKLASSQAI